MIHIIQKEILTKLISNKSQRYSQLKPKHLESNHFMYHLRVLIREGWVQKNETGQYCLTPEGMRFADQVNLRTLKVRRQPKIVTLVALQSESGQWLVYRRKHQPLLGQIGFPYGKLHLGETINQAAERELLEKTGLSAELTHRGDGYITINQKGEPVSQISFHLFTGRNPQGELLAQTHYGDNFWCEPETDFSKPDYMASMCDLIRLLKETPTNTRFFAEFTY